MPTEIKEKNLFAFSRGIDKICKNIRFIFHNNYSFITVLFLLFYSFEQGLLIYFSYTLSPELALGISMFVLVMMTTIGIERLLMESKNKKLMEHNQFLNKQNRRLFRKYVYVKKELKK